MNKAEIMRQKDMDSVLENYIRHQPGVTSQKLYDVCKEWAGQHWTSSDTHEFDLRLGKLLLRGFRVTNKQWYEKGHVSERKLKGPSKEDPRQTRMF